MFIKEQMISNRYKTKKRLGVGGMGQVWECEDIVLKRSVALKFVNEVYSASQPNSMKILEDEARLGAKLIGHPNIVSVLDYASHIETKIPSTIYYIVMEYIEGVNLDKWINEYGKKFDSKTIYYINLFIAWEFCKAINYAHLKGVLHRDIKPLNIFISNIGGIKVGDFGLARFVEEATRTHTVWRGNTAIFCAPEQWKGDKPTRETEIYQIGGTLYQLFTGKVPFKARNIVDLMNAHLNTEPISPKAINADIAEDLSNIIIRSLDKDSKNRPSLWEISDAISTEIQGVYELFVDVHTEATDVHELVNQITEFDIDHLKEGDFTYTFADFTEALSEAIQLILAGITTVKISKVNDKSKEEIS